MNLSKEQRAHLLEHAHDMDATGYHDDAKALRSLLAAPSADDAPTGWKLVPVEPTREMLDAAKWHDGIRTAKSVWNDMLAAAPTPEDAPSTAQGVTLTDQDIGLLFAAAYECRFDFVTFMLYARSRFAAAKPASVDAQPASAEVLPMSAEELEALPEWIKNARPPEAI